MNIIFCETKILDIFAVAKCENSSVGRARPCQGRGREFESRFSLFFITNAQVVELVDTQDLKSCGHYGCAGSSPAPGTKNR